MKDTTKEVAGTLSTTAPEHRNIFSPSGDITAHELASLLVAIGITVNDEWLEAHPEMKQHFTG